MRRLLLIALVLVPAAPAAVSPDVQQRIVPGRSIGKVAIGMTLTEVKKALGPHESVNAREPRGFGREYLELGWNFGEWRVGFFGKPGDYRAVVVASAARAERTTVGIGPGTPGKKVERTYGVRCLFGFFRSGGQRFADYWCVTRSRGGARTAYVVWFVCAKPRVYGNCPGSYPENGRLEVREVWVFAAGEPLPVTLHSDQPLP